MATPNTSVFGALAVIVIGFVAIIIYWLSGGQSSTITSFDECVNAGNPVLESYPEQCVTEDGRSFTREIGELQY